jgi:integrase
MADFVAFKRLQGYDYTKKAQELASFDRFLATHNGNRPVLRSDTLQQYLAATQTLAPNTRQNRLSAARQFCRYMQAFDPETFVPPPAILPRHPYRMRFYRLQPDQIQQLMQAASRLQPKHGLRPHTIRFLIGLLYATGLRIGEALNLELRDIDEDHASLFVRQGKFGKDRLVVLSPSTLHALQAWRQHRSHYAGAEAHAPLFVGADNRRLTYPQAAHAFAILCRLCGFRGPPPPRLHDLRHNYASQCLALWQRAGKDVDARLPVLAHAMGHVNIFSTQIYLHVNAESLAHAAAQFNAYVNPNQETSK